MTRALKFSELIAVKNDLELFIDTNLYLSQKEKCKAVRADFFSLAILLNGEVMIKINLKEKLTRKKNNLLFFAPNSINQIISTSKDTRIHFLAFTSKFLLQAGITMHEMEMLTFISSQYDGAISLTDEEFIRLEKIIEELEIQSKFINRHSFVESIVKLQFRVLLYELAAIGQRNKLSTKFKTTRKQEIVTGFAKLLEKHFKEERSLKYYATQLSISTKHLTEVVYDVTGKSAGVLIHEKLIIEIKYLLGNPSQNINQISEYLNFPNQSFFGKYFKRYCGLSPKEYREKILEGTM